MTGTPQSFKAWLWNGRQQITGRLLLLEDRLCFELAEFSQSHLQWEILYDHITSVEEFLLFGLARNGLRIESRDGQEDLFVVEEPLLFRQALEERLKGKQ